MSKMETGSPGEMDTFCRRKITCDVIHAGSEGEILYLATWYSNL